MGRFATVLLGVLAAATLAALFAVQADWAAQETPSGIEVHVTLVNRSAEVRYAGNLTLEDATGLGALDAMAQAGNFTYHVTYYPGFGSREAGAFVDAIDGERAAQGEPDGWIFRVHRGSGWVVPDRSAAIYPLNEGDAVVWAWSSTWDGD